MAVTAATIITKMRYELKDTSSDNYTDTELLNYVNEAVHILVDQTPMPDEDLFLRSAYFKTQTTSIVAGTPGYALPTGTGTTFYKDIGVRVLNSRGEVLPYPRLPAAAVHGSSQIGYTTSAVNLYLHPTPSVAVASGLILYYAPTITDAATTAANVEWADVFESIIRAYAVLIAKIRQEEDANSFANRYMILKGAAPKAG